MANDKPTPNKDEVFMLVREDKLWHSPAGTSAKECWDKAAEYETIRGGLTMKGDDWIAQMKKEGWEAQKVTITF